MTLLFDLDAGERDRLKQHARAAAHEARLVGRLRTLHGPGPAGAVCGDCAHLVAQGGCNRRYLKCRLGPYSRGPGTDWRARWQACGKFEARP